MRHTVTISAQSISYPLPQTKTDRFGHGMQLVITASTRPNNCVTLFAHYLAERDTCFPHHPELWLRCDGSIPTRPWFLRQLRRLIPDPNIPCEREELWLSLSQEHHLASFKQQDVGLLTNFTNIFDCTPSSYKHCYTTTKAEAT
jgi:hypothetical protein